MLKMMCKFALVGGAGVAVNMAVYVPLVQAGVTYLLAAVCSFLAAVTNNFIWNYCWTFRGRGAGTSVSRKYATFLVISLFNLGVNLLVLRLLAGFLAVREDFAQLGAIAVASVFNFTLHYLITFAERKSNPYRNGEMRYEAGCHTHVQ